MWMPGIERVETAAQGYSAISGIKPIAIVDHVMQGYQPTMVQWAKERPPIHPGAHFTIDRKGWIIQHVSIDKAAWHAGAVNQPTWKLMRYDGGRAINPNWYTVGIEHEGFSVPPGYGYDYVYSNSKPWPNVMIDASIEVHKWVCAQTGIKPGVDTIIGHNEIDGVNRKYDPGKLFPFNHIIDMVSGGGVPPPVNKRLAYMEIAFGRAKPIRREGDSGVYEIKVKL